MKKDRCHTVPLSDRAVSILKALHEQRDSRKRDAFIFPGEVASQPMRRASVWAQCKRSCGDGASVQGFRATLRSWMAARKVDFEVAELVLAHAGNALKQAYMRDELIDLRRPIMQQWADHLAGKDNVVPFKARA